MPALSTVSLSQEMHSAERSLCFSHNFTLKSRCSPKEALCRTFLLYHFKICGLTFCSLRTSLRPVLRLTDEDMEAVVGYTDMDKAKIRGIGNATKNQKKQPMWTYIYLHPANRKPTCS